MQISNHRYLEKVVKNLRQKLNLTEGQRIDLEIFLPTTMKASVHLGTKYNEKLEVVRNTNFEELTERLILEHETEILNVSPIGQGRDLHLRTIK